MIPEPVDQNVPRPFGSETPNVVLIDDDIIDHIPPREPSKILIALRKIVRWLARLVILCLVLTALLAYPAAIALSSKINDEIDMAMIDNIWADPPIGVATTMLETEIESPGWAPGVANWRPMARLDALPAYQEGISGALGDYALLLASISLRSGDPDPDLAAASRLLKSPSDASSIDRILAAIEAFKRYDGRVARQLAAAPTDTNALSSQLMLFALWAEDINSDVSLYADNASGLAFGGSVTRAFYRAKGMAYTASFLLEANREKYDALIETAGLKADYSAMHNVWRKIAELRPAIVSNGSADGVFFSNHLMALGYLSAEAEKASHSLAEDLESFEDNRRGASNTEETAAAETAENP